MSLLFGDFKQDEVETAQHILANDPTIVILPPSASVPALKPAATSDEATDATGATASIPPPAPSAAPAAAPAPPRPPRPPEKPLGQILALISPSLLASPALSSPTQATQLSSSSTAARHTATEHQPRGLVNQGNACYMNSVLQSLLATPPLFHLLSNQALKATLQQQNAYETHLASSSSLSAANRSPPPAGIAHTLLFVLARLASEFKKLTPTVLMSEGPIGKPLLPSYVYDNVYRLRNENSFRGRQEDAEEFLSFVLDRLHEEMVAELRKCSPESGLGPELDDATAAEDEDEWEEVGRKNKTSITRRAAIGNSPITQIFNGVLRSSIKQKGAKPSDTLQPFRTLPLEIQSDDIHTIHDAISHMMLPEAIQGYKKSSNSANLDAFKQLTFDVIPSVLVLHLKRFVYDNVGGTMKLFKRVDFTTELELPPDWLSSSAKISFPAKSRHYSLLAVVSHHGSRASGGHYTCEVNQRLSSISAAASVSLGVPPAATHAPPGSASSSPWSSPAKPAVPAPLHDQWLRFDDSAVTQVTERQVLLGSHDKDPYMLFYIRTDPPAASPSPSPSSLPKRK